MSVKVIIAGPRGKMGTEAVKMVEQAQELTLVGCIDRTNDGKRLCDITDVSHSSVPIYTDVSTCFKEIAADVLVDLTVPSAAFHHAKLALNAHIRPVIGTSGITNEQIDVLAQVAGETKTGCIIAPNFAVGACLMMKFAQMAAKHFPDVEIIEKHHDNKLDAPSGTAVKTAQLINENRLKKEQGHPDEKETIDGARGANQNGMHIHSVRLPGLIAHQEVMFGGNGQTLTIKHDSYNRESFMDGVKFSIHKVMEIDTLVYGLENILE